MIEDARNAKNINKRLIEEENLMKYFIKKD